MGVDSEEGRFGEMSTRCERVCVGCRTVPFKSGIYAPTSSLDSLRTVLALTHLRKLHLKTLDVSTAFMYAPVEDESCDLVYVARKHHHREPSGVGVPCSGSSASS